jgi:hypothetical protein
VGHEQIEILYKKAIKHASYAGHADIAGDFAGWITIKWLEGKAQHQTLGQSLIDFLRAEYGGIGDRVGSDAILRARRQPQTALPGCDESSVEENLERMHHSSSIAQGNMVEPLPVERTTDDPQRYLPNRLEEVWYLYTKEERSLKQIGEILNVCESRVSHLLSAVRRQILAAEAIREMRERIEDGRSNLEIEWIAI